MRETSQHWLYCLPAKANHKPWQIALSPSNHTVSNYIRYRPTLLDFYFRLLPKFILKQIPGVLPGSLSSGSIPVP
ncbi:MAG TPA: hypothetical protein PKA06_02695, partial [Gemmatales bacterium]|nr:hypothetical protein [Gemmatales bacterium]